MTMEFVQWKKILGEIDADKDLSKDNIIEKIKEKVEDKDEYEKWKKADFSVNHLFRIRSEEWLKRQ